MKARKVYYLFVLLLISFSVQAQDNESIQEKQISPLSPNAASLGNFGSIPVSLYTGIPNIQIPIYEIKVNDFSLPISLSYHASGVKVEDIPSWVGMGWTLNAGGMISRQMRGIVDERMIDKKDDYASAIDTLYDPNLTMSEKTPTINGLVNGNYDTESDLFSISAGGLSQKFFLDIDGNPYCLPANKLKIVHEDRIDFQVNYIDKQFARWKVTDKGGVKYIFGRSLDTLNATSWDGIELYTMQANCTGWTPGSISNSGDPWFVSSWYLNEIVLPTGESIDFTYEAYSFCAQQNLKGVHAVGLSGSSGNGGGIYEANSSGGMNYIQALRLKEITFPSGKVEFIVSGDTRRDIQGIAILEKIIISSLKSTGYQELKTFVLNTTNPEGNTVSGDNNFRLALLSLQETDKNGNSLPPYIFEYENQNASNFGLPSRLSKAQDLWGFYNGQTTNVDMIPTYILRDELGEMIHYIERANRSVSPEHAKYGTLKKIIYPTGGTTEFSYESNIARGVTDPNDPNSKNPLIKLANMEIIPSSNQSAGVGVTNTNGSDEGYSSTFEIFKSTGVDISVTSNILGGSEYCVPYTPSGGSGSLHDCFTISFEEETSPGNFTTINTAVYSDRSYNFNPGVYRVKLKWDQGGNLLQEYAQVYLSWSDFIVPSPPSIDEFTEMVVGGLRISKIIDYDPVSQKENVRHFSYNFNIDDPQIQGTSGTIMNSPLNYYHMDDYTYDDGIPDVCNNNPCNLPTTLHNAYVVTSYSNASIFQTNGGYVGYKKVSVDYGENKNGGRTSTYFLTAEDQIDGNLVNSQEYPFPPVIDYDWKRGLMEKEVQLKYTSGQYVPVKSTTSDYEFNDSPLDPNYESLSQIKISRIPGSSSGALAVMNIYNTISESSYQKESIITNHTTLGDFLHTTTYTQDDKTLGVASVSSTSSDGKVVETSYKYLQDYNNVDNIGTLKTNNIINKPIKVETTVDNILTQGIVTKYNDSGQVVNVYSYENETSTSPTAHDADVIVPINYSAKVIYTYDSATRKLVESKTEDDMSTSYIWSFNNSLPVAKVVNANYAQIASAISDLSSTFMEDLNTSIDQTDIYGKLASLRAEVEQDLPLAQVTTYTHDPLIGMTSQTDPNGITTYYEYDDFGRLKHIKDFEGNVLSKTEYHYKSQN